MSIPIDVTDRLQRALLLAGFAIDAKAMAVPVDPIQIPQTDEAAANSHDDHASSEAAQRALAAKAIADSIARIPEQHDAPVLQEAPDAVLNSLQSALKAVQVSLKDSPDVSLSDASQPDLHSGLHASSAGASDVAPHDSSAPALSIGSGLLLGTSAAAAQSDAATLNNPVPADSALSLDLSGSSLSLQPATQALAQSVDAVTDLVGNVANTVGDTLAGAVPALGPVLDAVDVVGTAVGDVASSAFQAVGAVTIPSLQGVGLDALSGLLAPSSAPAAEVADAAVTSIPDDLAGLAMVGVSEVSDVVQSFAADPLSPLQLVGSGLL